MRVITPLTITDALLTSSTAAEPAAGETAWNAATSYAVGAEVYRATTHKRYQALIAGVDSTYPENATSGTSPRWLELGATNKWAMFDLLRNSATEHASPLTVVLTPGRRVNSLAILATNAQTATISVSSGGVEVYSTTHTFLQRQTLGWYGYFFGEFEATSSLTLFDLPPYTDAVITITLTRAVGDVSCGALVVGNYTYIGKLKFSGVSDTLNFSTVDRDTWGNASMIQRRNVPATQQTLWLEKSRVNSVRAVRDALNATPAVWSGYDDQAEHDYYESLLILGFYRRFSINFDLPDMVQVDLELEEI